MFIRILRVVVSPRGLNGAVAALEPKVAALRGHPNLHTALLVRRTIDAGQEELLLIEHWLSPASRMDWVRASPDGDCPSPFAPTATVTTAAYEVLGSVLGGAEGGLEVASA